MQSSDSFVQIKLDIPHSLYIQLLAKSQSTGQQLSELAIQGIEQVLSWEGSNPDRLAQIEMSLENKLKEYVELRLNELLQERSVLTEQVLENLAVVPLDNQPLEVAPLPIPTIRPLQVGDRVLILEPDSPYYMAKLLVVRTSLIRATVETETGEKTFLKRDLRFIESTEKNWKQSFTPFAAKLYQFTKV